MFHVKHLLRMENLSVCPKCNNSDFELYHQCTDFTVTGQVFNIINCTKCHFKFTNPRPDSIEINKFYQSNNYISHSNSNKGLFNKAYHFIKKIAITKKIKLIESLGATNKNILDIGCGTGSFLGAIKNHGWSVSGIEPNKTARDLATNNFGFPIYEEDGIKSFPKASFSVITMWHVLEHVHLLKQRIHDIYNLLETDGFAIIAVPNHTSWDAQYYNKYWAAYDVPRHLYHFSPETIKELFIEQKLEHVHSIGMKYDSFYISLLSEKYKNSIMIFIKALLIGWYSNFKTKNNPEKYSSVIYIFQKK